MHYDPAHQPDRDRWLALDESERIELAFEHHRRARIKLPNQRLHAVMHAIVENQILMGDETPVAAIFRRLMNEGLDRHDAIHAVASVLAGVMFHAMKAPDSGDISAAYYSELAELTAAKWRAQADEGADP